MGKANIDFETRDEKGHWSPPVMEYSPLFQWPWKIGAVLKWLFAWGGYFWPRHLAYALLAVCTWFYLQADFSLTSELSASWIGGMLIRNYIFVIVVFGFYHLTLYILKVQGIRGKYHPGWQAKNSKKFMFKDQVKDNIFRSLVWSGYASY